MDDDPSQPYVPRQELASIPKVPPGSDKGHLTQILEVLQNPTITEGANDAHSKFWAAYKTESGQYDDDMLERCNGNMDIVLIFAGLFSVVIIAFIIAMQPNPVDTTNVLLVQLIQNISDGRSATQPIILPSSTGFSSSKLWMQALAYASLASNLLAAYSAVMGKQWLSHYKTTRFGGGSVKDRCQQRHRKSEELERWHFESVLRSFPVLLHISLLLFGLSLGTMLWTQQRSISIFVIAMITFGGLCHAFFITASLINHDSPFQTPVSLAIQAIFASTSRARASPKHQNEDPTKLAMEWILKTSRSPDVVRSVVELMPTMPALPDVKLVPLCEDVRDMFQACFNQRGIPILRDSALAYGKALIHFSSNYGDVRRMLHTTTKEWNPWERWRDLYVPEALEQCEISYNRILKTGDPGLKDSFRQDTCTALRMVVAAGIDHFAYPNDDDKEYTWIWNGKFGPLTADWLLDCPKEIHNMRVIDIDAVGNALLLFSYTQIEPSRLVQDRIAPFLNDDQSLKFRHIALRAAWQQIHCADMYEPFHATASFLHAVLKAIFPMVPNEQDRITNAIELLNFPEWPGGSDLATFPLLKIQFLVLLVLPAPKVDNLASYTPYCRALIRCMGRDRPHYLRRSASNIVCDTRRDLVKLATATRANKSLQDELCGGLITAPFTYLNDLPTNEENSLLMPIVRLVFILAKSSDWHPYLTRDGSIEEWIADILTHYDYDPFGNIIITTTDIKTMHCLFYLAGISLRIASPEQAASSFSAVMPKQWWDLMRNAWHIFYCFIPKGMDDRIGRLSDRVVDMRYPLPNPSEDDLEEVDDDLIESIPALVGGTKWHMPPDASKNDLKSLNKSLTRALHRLQQNSDESIRSEVEGLQKFVREKLKAVEDGMEPGELFRYLAFPCILWIEFPSSM